MKRFGRYEIILEIGRGGMGIVYLARDTQLDRQIVVKTPIYTSQAFLNRFENELTIQSGLTHPHIVPIYDMGVEKKAPFIVMKYMEGGSLAQRLKNGPLRLEKAIPIILKVGHVLSYIHAHKNGYLHRDIKPANILFDQFQQPYLTDFGIVRPLGFGGDGTIMIGTPQYMAPEQLRPGPPLTKTDIYQTGLLLYEMLAGYCPFEGDSINQIQEKITRGDIPSLKSIAPYLPDHVTNTVSKAMRIDPAERYVSIAKMMSEISQKENYNQTLLYTSTHLPNRLSSDIASIQKNILRMQQTFNRIELDLVALLMQSFSFSKSDESFLTKYLSQNQSDKKRQKELAERFETILQVAVESVSQEAVEKLIVRLNYFRSLETVLSSNKKAKVELSLDDPDIWQSVRSIQIKPGFYLIPLDASIKVEKKHTQYLSGPFSFRFESQSSYPLISTEYPSRSQEGIWKGMRIDWRQRPEEENDLILMTHSGKEVAYIQTRPWTGRAKLKGDRLDIQLQATKCQRHWEISIEGASSEFSLRYFVFNWRKK